MREAVALRDDNVRTLIGEETMRYRVHRFDIKMTRDQDKLEQFLNGLRGDVVSITPHVTAGFMWIPRVNFLFIVEKLR